MAKVAVTSITTEWGSFVAGDKLPKDAVDNLPKELYVDEDDYVEPSHNALTDSVVTSSDPDAELSDEERATLSHALDRVQQAVSASEAAEARVTELFEEGTKKDERIQELETELAETIQARDDAEARAASAEEAVAANAVPDVPGDGDAKDKPAEKPAK